MNDDCQEQKATGDGPPTSLRWRQMKRKPEGGWEREESKGKPMSHLPRKRNHFWSCREERKGNKDYSRRFWRMKPRIFSKRDWILLSWIQNFCLLWVFCHPQQGNVFAEHLSLTLAQKFHKQLGSIHFHLCPTWTNHYCSLTGTSWWPWTTPPLRPWTLISHFPAVSPYVANSPSLSLSALTVLACWDLIRPHHR